MTKTGGEADHGAKIPKWGILGPQAQDTMMSGMAALMVAIGGTSLICYLLMNRVQNRKARREGVSDSGSYGSGDSSSSDGWSLFSWGGSDSSSHDSSSSSDSGGDSGGGGGDSGGGGGGD